MSEARLRTAVGKDECIAGGCALHERFRVGAWGEVAATVVDGTDYRRDHKAKGGGERRTVAAKFSDGAGDLW